METLVHRLQYVVAAVLLIVIVAMLPALVSAAAKPRSQTGNSLSGSMTSSPNSVTRSFGYIIGGTSRISNQMSSAIATSAGNIACGVSNSGHFALSAAAATAGFGGRMATATIHGIGHALYLTASIPASVFEHTTHAIARVGVIRPADDAAAPTIDPASAVLAAAITKRTAHTEIKVQPIVYTGAVIWPLRGTVTTLFGVPELPYQPIHTGIDISDGEPAGVSPIHAFKPGVVIRVIHEHIKLGNEVVVSHGNGMTSVYGHLDSTSVRVGQLVTTRTVVGYEGTTGVSTGPHLHFEIRINGTPVNPARYIPGQP